MPDLKPAFLICETRECWLGSASALVLPASCYQQGESWLCGGENPMSLFVLHREESVSKGNLPLCGAQGAAGRPPLLLTLHPGAISQPAASG